jgi:flagellar basal-body rod protein FlgF
MTRGIYTAATGMLAQQFVQDALAGNLANINTAGFKQDVPTFRALQELALRRYDGGTEGSPAIGDIGLGTAFDHTVTDLSAGPVVKTDNPYDLALVGSGFFTVQTPQGERYTRDGQFHLEPAGKDPAGKPVAYLADDSGHRVLGLKGPINLGGAKVVEVNAQGSVLADKVEVDKLKLVGAPAAAVVHEGGNLYALRGTAAPSTATVRQYYYEQSNVNAIGAMVKMITVQRAYEAAQRAITAQDETLNKTVNEMGRL